MNRIAFLLILGVFISAHSHAALIPDPGRVQTVEIQTAIDSISEAGGGVLCLSGGDYVSGTILFQTV